MIRHGAVNRSESRSSLNCNQAALPVCRLARNGVSEAPSVHSRHFQFHLQRSVPMRNGVWRRRGNRVEGIDQVYLEECSRRFPFASRRLRSTFRLLTAVVGGGKTEKKTSVRRNVSGVIPGIYIRERELENFIFHVLCSLASFRPNH